MLLCHHPPDWLLDYETVEDKLNSRIQVQLFGHKHRQRMHQIGKSIRIYAGALHPSRGEAGWEPRYNVLCLRVDGTSGRPELVVQVWSRVWDDARARFIPDIGEMGQLFQMFHLPIQSRRTFEVSPTAFAPPAAAEPTLVAAQPSTVAPEEADMGPQRKLIYRFFSLPFHKRIEVAVKLGLLRDEDEGLEDTQLFERVLTRAQEGDRLSDLWAAVEAQHGNSPNTTNPFA